jgi:hypothetical protein
VSDERDVPATSDAALPEPSRRPRGAPAVYACAVVAAIVLWGGYVRRWSWTGFSENDTLWDWLHLLLVPIVLASLPIWLLSRGQLPPRRRAAIAAGCGALVVLVVVGYAAPLRWTGFPGNTLWDWLELVVLPISLVGFGLWARAEWKLRPAHHVGLAITALALAALVVLGYALSLQWTGFPGNTLWDWLELAILPVVMPLVVIPAATAWLAPGGAPDAETAADGAPVVAPRTAARIMLAAVILLGAGTAFGAAFGTFGRSDPTPARAAAAATAAGRAGPCATSAGTVVAAAGVTRVLHAGSTFVVCRGAVDPRPARLAAGSAAGRWVAFRVSGPRVIAARQRCAGAAQARRCDVEVDALRARAATPFVRLRLGATGPLTGLVVSPGGAIAAMVGPGCAGGCAGPRLVLVDARGTRTVAAGAALDASSLAGHGTLVYWRDGGQAQSATLSS